MNKDEQSGTYASDEYDDFETSPDGNWHEYDAYCECDECEPEDDVNMVDLLALLFVAVIIVGCLGWLVS